jgi:hypothetical protein
MNVYGGVIPLIQNQFIHKAQRRTRENCFRLIERMTEVTNDIIGRTTSLMMHTDC